MKKSDEESMMESNSHLEIKQLDIAFENDFFSGCPIPGNPSHPWYKSLSRVFGCGLIFAGLSIVTATSITVLMIKPILNHRGYIPTNCTVTHSGIYKWQNCSCGLSCISQIPCGRVIVSYPTTSEDVIQGAILHEDQINARLYPLCSISTSASCYQSTYKEHNRRDVEMFTNKTGKLGNVMTCFYCSWDEGRVVLQIIPPRRDIVTLLGVSWGLVFFFIFFLFTVGLILSSNPYNHLQQNTFKKKEGLKGIST